MSMSIFNSKKNLTHLPQYAEICGISSQELIQHLHSFITDGREVKRVIEFLQNSANGYKFFGAKIALFNPQLIQEFLDSYVITHILSHSHTHALTHTHVHTLTHTVPFRYQGGVYHSYRHYTLFDPNQMISSRNILLASHTPEIANNLIRACVVGESFEGYIEIESDQVCVIQMTDNDIRFGMSLIFIFIHTHSSPRKRICTRWVC